MTNPKAEDEKRRPKRKPSKAEGGTRTPKPKTKSANESANEARPKEGHEPQSRRRNAHEQERRGVEQERGTLTSERENGVKQPRASWAHNLRETNVEVA